MKKALTLAPTTPFSKAQAITTWHLPSAITTPQAPAASTFSSIRPGAATSPPSSVTGSDATAGAGGNFDLAAAFGDGLSGLSSPDATGANFLVDILPAVEGLDSALSTLLADIASLF